MAKKVEVRAAYQYDADAVSAENGLVMPAGEGRTIQSQKEETDINVILDRFGITGHLPQDVRPPTFQDFGPDFIFDFRSAVEQIAMAEDAFMSMPARVRTRFDNDPQKFVEFCSATSSDGQLANLKEMRELGLAVPERKAEPEKVQKVEVVNPSTK